MRLSSFTWLITYISLAIALVWFFASTTYCIYSYTLLLGASWPIGSALVIGAAAFISAPWDLIMRLGWKGFGTLLWRDLLAMNDQFHLSYSIALCICGIGLAYPDIFEGVYMIEESYFQKNIIPLTLLMLVFPVSTFFIIIILI
jgi:hypothetical protein